MHLPGIELIEPMKCLSSHFVATAHTEATALYASVLLTCACADSLRRRGYVIGRIINFITYVKIASDLSVRYARV